MQYDHALGREGNMKNLYNQLNKTNNTVFNNKIEADENNLRVEQSLTDLDIATMESEQLITDLDIRLMVLEEA